MIVSGNWSHFQKRFCVARCRLQSNFTIRADQPMAAFHTLAPSNDISAGWQCRHDWVRSIGGYNWRPLGRFRFRFWRGRGGWTPGWSVPWSRLLRRVDTEVMADKDAKERLRGLGETAANFNPDSHIPIRRYFRWHPLVPNSTRC